MKKKVLISSKAWVLWYSSIVKYWRRSFSFSFLFYFGGLVDVLRKLSQFFLRMQTQYLDKLNQNVGW